MNKYQPRETFVPLLYMEIKFTKWKIIDLTVLLYVQYGSLYVNLLCRNTMFSHVHR